MNFNENWNLIGLPLVIENASGYELFPGSIENTLNTINEYGNYINIDTMHTGVGYWLRFETGGASSLIGYPITENILTIQNGWNLISGLSMDVGISSIIDPDSILYFNTLYTYSNETYSHSDSLKAGSAYWVRSSADGVIEIKLNP